MVLVNSLVGVKVLPKPMLLKLPQFCSTSVQNQTSVYAIIRNKVTSSVNRTRDSNNSILKSHLSVAERYYSPIWRRFVGTMNGVFANESDNYILSPEQIKFYEDNGFLVIKDLIDFTSLYTYKQRFVQICNGVVPAGNIRVVKEPSLAKLKLKPEDYINKIQELLYDDVFITYGEHPRMLSVLSQFIGDDITAVNSMFINKPPGASRHPPHQDLFYFPFRPAEKIIGAWTAVDHVNKENGCLYAIPGSHKAKTLYEHAGKKDALKLYHGVDEEEIAPLDKRVHLEMSPGDTVFLHPYLLHGSGPNVSKNYRKAITFHFANSSCHYINLEGTIQEHVAKEVEAQGEKLGFTLGYVDAWRLKSKQVKGVRSNL